VRQADIDEGLTPGGEYHREEAQTDRTEQMIPVEAEDIPLVKQIAQVPRRVLHRIERMPTSVSLFVWLPEERAKWVEMRAKRDRAIRAILGQ